MYEAYWNLNKKPFEIGSDPDFYFPAEGHQAVFLKLRYLLETRRGSALLLGENGTGKSLLVTLLGRLHLEGSPLGPFFEVNMPRFGSQDLLFYLAEKVRETSSDAAKKIASLVSGAADDQPPVYKAFSTVERALTRLAAEGRRPVLVIEGADRIDDADVWSTLASLIELESEGAPLLSLLLTASPKKLHRPIPFVEDELEAAAELLPLGEEETIRYIAHRLRTAGASRRDIFTRGALSAIARLTGGVPRKINRLGDMALLVGYAEQLPRIEEEMIVNLNNELIPS